MKNERLIEMRSVVGFQSTTFEILATTSLTYTHFPCLTYSGKNMSEILIPFIFLGGAQK